MNGKAVLALSPGWAWSIAIAWLLAYEFYALYRGTALLTDAALYWFERLPILECAAGALIAHFFWRARP